MKQTILLSVLSCLSVIVAPALATPHSPLRSVKHQTLTSRAYNENDSTLVARDEKGYWVNIKRKVFQHAIIQVRRQEGNDTENDFPAVEFVIPTKLWDCEEFWFLYNPEVPSTWMSLFGRQTPWRAGGLTVQINDIVSRGKLNQTSTVGPPVTGSGDFTAGQANYEITFHEKFKSEEEGERNKQARLLRRLQAAEGNIVGNSCY